MDRTPVRVTGRQAVVVALVATVQVGLFAAARADLRRRPPEAVNGSRRLWRLATYVNFVGPLAWFARGRRTVADPAA